MSGDTCKYCGNRVVTYYVMRFPGEGPSTTYRSITYACGRHILKKVTREGPETYEHYPCPKHHFETATLTQP